MPSLEHEPPLVVLREEPGLVPALLRDSLGVRLPAFDRADVGESDFSQPLPFERRADLVIRLLPGSGDEPPVMGIVVEVQRARDDNKWRSWPLYVASLHARLRCPTCLVVIATDEPVARWAATPITTLQPRSPFVPLVLGPGEVPRMTRAGAVARPWLAVLSGLVHGNRADGGDVVRAAASAVRALPEGPAGACYDLLYASLEEGPRGILEEEMHFENYEYRSEPMRRAFGDGARTIILALVDRHGAVRPDLRARVEACDEPEVLRELATAVAAAPDRMAVESLLTGLPPRALDG